VTPGEIALTLIAVAAIGAVALLSLIEGGLP